MLTNQLGEIPRPYTLIVAIWIISLMYCGCSEDTGGSTLEDFLGDATLEVSDGSDRDADVDWGSIAGENIAGEGVAGTSIAGENNAGENNAGENNAGENNAGENNAGENNAGENNAGENNAGENNAGEVMAGEEMEPRIPRGAIANYLTCRDNLDCPNRSDAGSYGGCVTEIPLNRPDGDVTSVNVSELFNLEPGVGVCGAACSDNLNACNDLWIRDEREVPYQCQIVYRGAAPYPTAPLEFPFAETLSPEMLLRGTPFGALCRPPFELAGEVVEGFCGSCTSADECSGGLCWSATSGAVFEPGDGSGECLTPCGAGGGGDEIDQHGASDDEAGCPLGFQCEALEEGQFCVPIEVTCTACLDRDGDLRGDGFCSILGDISAHDCDDTDPRAYYDANAPDHPFPDSCGEVDRNCNGLSDAAEVVGNPAYSELHCTSCNDPCTGRTQSGNGDLTCLGEQGATMCGAICDEGWETCSPDELCVVSSSDLSRRRYRDLDEDGFGDPDDYQFLCSEPLGPFYTAVDNTDCDDSEAEVSVMTFPGAPELCNGRDDDCDPDTPDGVDDDTHVVGGECHEGDTCGTYACDAGWVCQPYPELGQTCIPTEEPAPVGVCADTIWRCGEGGLGLVCEGSAPTLDDNPYDGVDQDCDGWPGDESAYVFVRSRAGSGDGSRSRPFNTLSAAITLAAERGVDVIIGGTSATGGDFVISEALQLREGVSLLGGFDESFNPILGELREVDRAQIVRTREVSDEGAHAVALLGIATPNIAIRNVMIRFNETTGPTQGIGHIGIHLRGSDGVRLDNVRLEVPSGIDGALVTPYSAPAQAGQDGAVGVTPNGNGGSGGAPITRLNYECFEGSIKLIAGPLTVVCRIYFPQLDINLDYPYIIPGTVMRQEAGRGANGGASSPTRPGGVGGRGGSIVVNAADGTAGRGGEGGVGGAFTDVNTNFYVIDCAQNSTCPVRVRPGHNGQPGLRGAGGGGGGGGAGDLESSGGRGAQGGSGGEGGLAGMGGASGGSSFGLLIVNTTLDLESTVFVEVGDGGQGAAGQAGQQGGTSSAGGQAAVVMDNEVDHRQGGDGGAGGAGGGGGGGAGGHGGNSACIARSQDREIPIGIICERYGTPGSAGAGGVGGSGGTFTATIPDLASINGGEGAMGRPGVAAAIINID